jgi:glucose-1-phosphatase
MDTAPVKAVLFDLGVVMLHLRYDRALAQALPLCDPARVAGGKSFLTLLDRTHLIEEYECGRISAQAFYDHFVEQSGFRGDFSTFAAVWRSIFEENDAMIDFGAEVARQRPTYFLTNASDLHVPWVFEHFPRLRFHRGCVCSCYVGATKPAREFYEAAMQQLRLDPRDGLFVDDRPENVAGAEAFGIRSILHTESTDTISRVKRALNFT